MTRKQAIEEARMRGSFLVSTVGELADEYRKVAEFAYDLGRIAGLMEAVEIADNPEWINITEKTSERDRTLIVGREDGSRIAARRIRDRIKEAGE